MKVFLEQQQQIEQRRQRKLQSLDTKMTENVESKK